MSMFSYSYIKKEVLEEASETLSKLKVSPYQIYVYSLAKEIFEEGEEFQETGFVADSDAQIQEMLDQGDIDEQTACLIKDAYATYFKKDAPKGKDPST